MSNQQPVIVFALFPDATQLDFTGPYQVFAAVPGAEVILASVEGGMIEASGMTFAGLRRLGDIPGCDVVCVPGGRGATDRAIHDAVFLRELRRLAATARFVTSVCTGSLVLGAAGLLRGKRADISQSVRRTVKCEPRNARQRSGSSVVRPIRPEIIRGYTFGQHVLYFYFVTGAGRLPAAGAGGATIEHRQVIKAE